jgi:hypothetical protein
MKIRTPQQFENDFFPGWDENKKHASAATLKWQEKFIAEKKALIVRARWWRAPDLRRRRIVIVR